MRSLLIILLVCCVFSLNLFALNSSSEWRLRVLIEKADIQQEPDVNSPVVTTVDKDVILDSYEQLGKWFKVIVKSDEDGSVSIGYILSSDVEILSEKLSQETDFWEEEPENFQGIGLRVKLTGGVGYFFGGDIGRGIQGLYDQRVGFLSSQGFSLDGSLKSFHNDIEVSGDLIIDITPTLGIGIGSGNIYGNNSSTLLFQTEESKFDIDQLTNVSEIRVTPLRVGVFFSLPISRLFNVSFNAGPGIYFAKFINSIGSDWEGIADLGHMANATGFGVHGGIGLELNLHRRAVFFVECQGRYAKISNFKGTATTIEWGELIYQGRRDSTTTVEEGSLYYIEDTDYSGFIISEDTPSGFRSVKQAVFDFSGFSLRAGFIFRF